MRLALVGAGERGMIYSRYAHEILGARIVAVADLVGMLMGSLSPLVIGALSNRLGIRGFEIGFSLMGGAYVLGACSMAFAALFTFKKDRIVE